MVRSMRMTRRRLITFGAAVLVLLFVEMAVPRGMPTVQTGYVTIFRTSYFSNWQLLECFFFLALGIFAAIASILGRKGLRKGGWSAIIFMFVWCCVWIPTWTWLT